jgi:hypothetical protein
MRGAAKVAAICAVVFLVSLGLCGAEGALLSSVRHMPDTVAGIFIGIGVLGAVGAILSAVVGFVALLVWAFGSALRRRGGS